MKSLLLGTPAAVFLARLGVLGVLGVGLFAPAVRADEVSFDGGWTMSAITETFIVRRWGTPCGPPPVSGTMLTGGPTTIRSERGELAIIGNHRTLRTDQCLDAMPTLIQDTHSHDSRSWRTRCATPPKDSRHALVNTAFFVAPGDDSISIAETGRYEFTLAGERCVADVQRRATLARLVAPDPARVSAVASGPGAAPAVGASRIDCQVPGEPARLEVRPSRKVLRLGETFAFHGIVVDVKGCLTGPPVVWSIGPVTFSDGRTHAARPWMDANGRLTVPQSDFEDATFDVIAAAGGRTARASVKATSADNFEALVAQSGLDSKGESVEPAIANLATSTIGAESAHAEDGASKRRTTFLIVVGGLALTLGVVAAVGARRARRARIAEQAAEGRHVEKMREYEVQKRERARQHADQMRAHVQSVALAQQQAAAAAARGMDSGPSFCPSCRREFGAGVAFCPFDANGLVAIAGHETLLSGPGGGVCPTCKRGFNPGVKVCPHDGESLVPPIVAIAQAGGSSPPLRGKICPICGGRFDGYAAFCSKDGAQLVTIN